MLVAPAWRKCPEKTPEGGSVVGIRGTGPILGPGNSELLITVALLNHLYRHDQGDQGDGTHIRGGKQ